MAHTISQTATQAEPSHDSSLDIEDSDSTTKEGTFSDRSGASESVSAMSPNSFVAEEKLPCKVITDSGVCAAVLGDISCGSTKKKKMNTSRKVKDNVRDKSRSECRAIKAGAEVDTAVSSRPAARVGGCETLSLATNMERVNPELFTYGRTGSPYPSSDNEWEASDHSDTDTDHSDSSDDDNPTSQVDRMIERGTRLIMDGENSNLSSETDDTDDSDDLEGLDDDSDSDITDVSPLVSTTGSPLGLSPVLSRRILPSSVGRSPFVRHYSNGAGHEGDVEDDAEDEEHDYHFVQPAGGAYRDEVNGGSTLESADMTMVVQALLNFGVDSTKNSIDNDDEESLDVVNHNAVTTKSPLRRRMSPALQANPHHRHLRKLGNASRRKNMSFTNEEVRIINRDNSIILEKLLAVSNRPDKTNTRPAAAVAGNRLPTAAVNRRRQEDGIRKENLAILRRLQDVKPSRTLSSGRSTHHHSKSHYHHKSAQQYESRTAAAAARSCSATARQTSFSPQHHHHHHHHHHQSPKETAL